MLPVLNIMGVQIQTYYLYLSLWTSVLIWWCFHLAYVRGLNVRVALNICIIILITGFMGARLMHVTFEQINYYISFPQKIFYFWEGGFVFMGGLFAALFSVLIYFYWKKHNFWEWADFFAPILAVGYGGGRFACFLAGCCFGGTCLYPWKVTFGDGIPRHPTQLYALVFELILAALLFRLQKIKLRTGTVFSIWLIGHGIGRLFMEYFRADFRGILIRGLTVSTWLSFILIVIGALALLWLQSRKTSDRSDSTN